MCCPVCDQDTEVFERARVLGRWDAEYRRCNSCGFLFAASPVWLEEAYSLAITGSDIGLVARNLWFAKLAASVVQLLFNANGRFLDFGGGTGLFTRLMRDKGFDWYWSDSACRNMFAAGFEARPDQRYELVTAAEVFEHLTDPVPSMEQMTSLSSNILLTTQLLPDPPPRLGSWWYYSLEHGQHVSFYTRRTLELLGERFGLHLSSNGKNLHLFSRKKVPDLLFQLLTSSGFSSLVAAAMPRRSLLPVDFERVRVAAEGAVDDAATD